MDWLQNAPGQIIRISVISVHFYEKISEKAIFCRTPTKPTSMNSIYPKTLPLRLPVLKLSNRLLSFGMKKK